MLVSETENHKKKHFHGTGCQFFSVALILASRSQRGNKQYFNLGLTSLKQPNSFSAPVAWHFDLSYL
jgi:hypothetical protein